MRGREKGRAEGREGGREGDLARRAFTGDISFVHYHSFEERICPRICNCFQQIAPWGLDKFTNQTKKPYQDSVRCADLRLDRNALCEVVCCLVRRSGGGRAAGRCRSRGYVFSLRKEQNCIWHLNKNKL